MQLLPRAVALDVDLRVPRMDAEGFTDAELRIPQGLGSRNCNGRAPLASPLALPPSCTHPWCDPGRPHPAKKCNSRHGARTDLLTEEIMLDLHAV